MADTSSNNLAGATGGGGRDRPGKPLSPSERRQREHVERLHAGAFGRRAPSPPEEEVDAEETALREWLESCGFRPGNLRSPETLQRDHSMITPLMCACRWGRLDVCKWLANRGAAEDMDSQLDLTGRMLLSVACEHGHLMVCKWLLEKGAAAELTISDRRYNYMYAPMHYACDGGHLSVCKWLVEVGGRVMTTKTYADRNGHGGKTPIFAACSKGHLPICKWLFRAGAARDISKADSDGCTPMRIACSKGHLPICKWLFEVGAAADITKAAKDGIWPGQTPCFVACVHGHLSVCRWLVLSGAMNKVQGEHEGIEHDPAVGHGDRAIIRQDTCRPAYDQSNVACGRPSKQPGCHRPALLAWAQGAVADHRTFRFAFLPGTLSTLQRRGSAHLWKLGTQGSASFRMFKELIAEFMGHVEVGRRLRNVREFAEVLASLPEREDPGEAVIYQDDVHG
jgi:hypothetical protein